MFSVVTISRDRPAAFLNHLLSLKNQITSEQDYWELIVLDDSTEGNDGQEQVIKKVCSDMPENCTVRAFRALERKVYGGEGKTINFGVKQTTGDPIFVLCGDDIYPSYHLFMMHSIWNKFIDAGYTDRVLGWPLYHLKPFIALDSNMILNSNIDSVPEVDQGFLALRQARFPDTPYRGLDVADTLVDDRCCFSREFLFNVKGWPEWNGCWWRDAWFQSIAHNRGYKFHCDWGSWSLHQWHQRRAGMSVGDGEAKAYYDKHATTALTSNEDNWGEQKIREIEIG